MRRISTAGFTSPRELPVGEFVDVKITGYQDYDLLALPEGQRPAEFKVAPGRAQRDLRRGLIGGPFSLTFHLPPSAHPSVRRKPTP